MADGQGHRTPYWVAERLTATARARWSTFDGWCAARNVDPLALPIDRFCNLVYYWLTRNITKEQKLLQFDAELNEPPPSESRIDDEGAWSADAEMAAFTQAMGATR